MTTRTRLALLCQVLLALIATHPAHAQSFLDKMRDPEDGAFDISAWLATAGGVLPVVIPITEPAVGYGAAVALAFFHRPPDWDIDEARRRFEARERISTPSVSVGLGMYTENGSWIAGGGHLGVWGDDRWRYTGGLAALGLKLSVSEDVGTASSSLLSYELDGWALIQEIQYRIADTRLRVGLGYDLLQTRTSIPTADGAAPVEAEAAIGSISSLLLWDTRNNDFTTDRGLLAQIEGGRSAKALGGDFDYWTADGKALLWLNPVRPVVVGLRADGGIATDGVPFFAKPAVDLRGVPVGRYTGDRTVTLEGEVRWDFARRWSLVGFGGGGLNVTENLIDGGTWQRWIGGGGGGFRYLVARAFGMRAGLDFAWGPDGFALYVTSGSTW